MTASKASPKAPIKSKVVKTPAASKAAEIEIAPAAAPKPARKPAAAKAVPVEAVNTVAVTAKVRKAPVNKAPPVAVVEAAQEAAPAVKPVKPKKDKLIRDSFTMPESEYAAIAALKKRCLDSGVAAKKSEILRAAIAGMARLYDAEVVAAVQGLAAIKTGRPAKAAK